METIEPEVTEVTEITEPIVANTIPAEVPIEDTEEFIQLVKNSVDEQYIIQWLFGKGFDWIGAYTVLKRCVVNHELFIQTYVDHLDEMLRCIPEMEQDANKMMEIYQSSGYENIIARYIKNYKKVGDATAYTLYRLFVWKNGFYDKRNFNKLIKTVNTYTRKAKEIYPEVDECSWLTECILNNESFMGICKCIDRSKIDTGGDTSVFMYKYMVKYHLTDYIYFSIAECPPEEKTEKQKKADDKDTIVLAICMLPAFLVAGVTYAAAGLCICVAIYILISGFFAMIS